MKDTTRHKGLVQGFVDAVNARDYAAVRDLISDDFVRICPATPDVVVKSADDFLQFLEQDAAMFPDNQVTTSELVAEGDRVAFWATYTGTQQGPMGPFPPSDRRMTCEFAGVFRFAQGRIIEVRLTWDNVGVLVQLGHLTAPG